MFIVPATREAEAGESLEHGRSRLQQAVTREPGAREQDPVSEKIALLNRYIKMWSICMMECYYSAIKRNEALTWATAWMGLESLLPRERIQTRKATCCVTPFYQVSRMGNS